MLKIDSAKTITSMSSENVPIIHINSGEIFSVKTLDCFSGKIRTEDDLLKNMPWKDINPATGPIYINGADKGDVLQVTILDIKIADCAIILSEAEDLTRFDYHGEEKTLFSKIVDGKVYISDKVSVLQSPMIGVIGTAPSEGNVPTTLPGEHGGNMDNTHITIGSVVFLPVYHKGALLALGDLHAIMADGEPTGSGFEVSGEVTLKVDVLKSRDIPLPMVKNDALIETIASADSLDEASVLAVEKMLRYLTKYCGIDVTIAWKLVSACGNVEICQFANAIKTSRCCLPIRHLELFSDKKK